MLLFVLVADVYVSKPFSPRELLARLQSAIRRSRRTRVIPNIAEQHAFGRCTVHFGQMTAEITLTTLEIQTATLPDRTHGDSAEP